MLLSVELSEFCQFKHKKILFSGPGVYGITGPNGTGKSNFIESIFGALTDTWRTEGPKTDNARIGRSGDTFVELVLELEELAVLRRELSPSKNFLKIGSYAPITRSKDIAAELQNFSGVSAWLLGELAFVRQGQIAEFLSRTYAERVANFQRLFGMESVTKLKQLISDKLIKTRVIDFDRAALDEVRSQLERYESMVSSLAKDISSLEKTLIDVEKYSSIVDWDRKFKVIEQTNKSKHELLKKSEIRRNELITKIEEVEADIAVAEKVKADSFESVFEAQGVVDCYNDYLAKREEIGRLYGDLNYTFNIAIHKSFNRLYTDSATFLLSRSFSDAQREAMCRHVVSPDGSTTIASTELDPRFHASLSDEKAYLAEIDKYKNRAAAALDRLMAWLNGALIWFEGRIGEPLVREVARCQVVTEDPRTMRWHAAIVEHSIRLPDAVGSGGKDIPEYGKFRYGDFSLSSIETYVRAIDDDLCYTLMGYTDVLNKVLTVIRKEITIADLIKAHGSEDYENCALCGVSRSDRSKLGADLPSGIPEDTVLSWRQFEIALIKEMADVTKLMGILKSLAADFDSFKKYVTDDEIVHRLKEWDEKRDLIGKQLGSTPEAQKAKMLVAKERLKSFTALNDDLNKIRTELASLKAQKIQIEESIGDITESLTEFDPTRKYSDDEIIEANRQLLHARDNELKLAGLTERYREVCTRRAELTAERNSLEERAVAAGKTEAWRSTLESLSDKLSYDSIPKIWTRRKLDMIEPATNGILEVFDAPFRVSIGETLVFNIEKTDGVVHTDARLSGAERLILALAFRLAMAREFAGKLKLLCLDEPTYGMDEHNLRKFCDVMPMLKSFCKSTGMQILVVTHEKSLADCCDSVYDLSK